jgi:hypothetical protein
MDKTDIEACFRKAFTFDPPPTGDRLVKILGDIDKRQEIRKIFSGRRWWELAPDLIMEHDDAISFMEPEGRRYYLPAYLIATLYADPEWFFSEMVIYHLYLPLTRPEGDPIRTKFERFLGLLSAEEKSAVRKFLEYLIDHDPSDAAEEALRVLWHKF